MATSQKYYLRGFTLIELLVVIAIIALLVSILLPSLNQARDIAKGMKCMTNLRAIGMGVNLYAENYNGYLPFVHDPDRNKWATAYQYPLQEYTDATPEPSVAAGVKESIYWCPSEDTHNQVGWPGDYGMNGALFASNPGGGVPVPHLNIAEIQNPGELIAFLDGTGCWVGFIENAPASVDEINSQNVLARHGNAKAVDDGKVNVLWLDTHVTSNDWGEITGGDGNDTYWRYWND